VWVPDAAHEALRDLVRAREAAKRDQLRARHRLAKFLLRHGRRPSGKGRAWTTPYFEWLETVRFPYAAQEATGVDYLHEVHHAAERVARFDQAIDAAVATAPPAMRAVMDALQALRGIAQVAAVTIVAELGQVSRFTRPRQLMGYSGAVPREDSSGSRTRRGGITKTGNAHLRRVLVESAWAYRYAPHVGPALRRRQAGVDATVNEIAWKAQHRLHARYRRLTGTGKCRPQVVTAIARELLGFIWAITVHTEAQQRPVAA